MARRRAGVGGIRARQRREEAAEHLGGRLAEDAWKQSGETLEAFKVGLEKFARKYKAKINKDPEFRRQFQRMTQQVGVDPLASNKGFWGEILGVGDFYFELAVQVVNVCLATRPFNGGLLDLAELQRHLIQMRGSHAQAIGYDDIERAVQKLRVLGSGYDLVSMGGSRMIVSVPVELNPDHSHVLAEARKAGGWVTQAGLQTSLGWTPSRAARSLETLLKEGMAWIDDQAKDGVRRYWFPSVRPEAGAAGEGDALGGAGGAAGRS